MGEYLSTPVRDCEYENKKVNNIDCHVSAMQGWRLNMEDAHLIDCIDEKYCMMSVFDGHGGEQVSTYCARNMKKFVQNELVINKSVKECLMEAYKKLDASMLTKEVNEQLAEIRKPEFYDTKVALDDYCNVAESVGSTAVTAILHENELTVANVGDSRCLVVKKDEIKQLTTDHRTNIKTEVERIKKCGGFVRNGRVNEKLSLTRALGDFEFKQNKDVTKQIISCIPEITDYTMEGDEEMIIIGCDGIFDSLSNEELVALIRKGLMEGKSIQKVCEDILNSIVANDPYEQAGNDNMTLMVSFVQ